MFLFGKKEDKKEESVSSCCCGGSAKPQTSDAKVLILGSGCANCNALERSVREAMAELGLQEEVGHVTDFGRIAAYGVMSTPALVVDGKVLSSGRVLSREQARELLRTARGLA